MDFIKDDMPMIGGCMIAAGIVVIGMMMAFGGEINQMMKNVINVFMAAVIIVGGVTLVTSIFGFNASSATLPSVEIVSNLESNTLNFDVVEFDSRK